MECEGPGTSGEREGMGAGSMCRETWMCVCSLMDRYFRKTVNDEQIESAENSEALLSGSDMSVYRASRSSSCELDSVSMEGRRHPLRNF